MELLVQLSRGIDDQLVGATLLSLTQKHVDDFVTRWQPALIQATQADKYRDWEFKERMAETQDISSATPLIVMVIRKACSC